MKTILVVDDEMGIRELLAEILFDEGYQVDLAENAEQARIYRQTHQPDLVLLDIWMPDVDGIALLKEWLSENLLTMPVVMMSGHGTIETAMEATRIGAVDFLEKPISLQKLLSTVSRAMSAGMRPILHAEPKPVEVMVAPDLPRIKELSAWLALPLREAHEQFDAYYFQHHLVQEDENMTRIAEKTGMERTHLYRKLKQLGIKLHKKSAQ
ncbi:MAG: response regulator [Gallionella sp.]|nr:response regulator [Gallionella sp.]